jgi:hypothetical protein
MSRARPYVRRGAALQERLDHYTDKSAGPEGCWPWMGALAKGYGHLYWRGRRCLAHRLSFEVANGTIPPGAHVLHRCDNPRCVNPAHLSAGSHLDNMRDMHAKGRGRAPAGELNARAKLTAEMVIAIRAATGLQREIGQMFGVSGETVRKIKLGRSWKHIPLERWSPAFAGDAATSESEAISG